MHSPIVQTLRSNSSPPQNRTRHPSLTRRIRWPHQLRPPSPHLPLWPPRRHPRTITILHQHQHQHQYQHQNPNTKHQILCLQRAHRPSNRGKILSIRMLRRIRRHQGKTPGMELRQLRTPLQTRSIQHPLRTHSGPILGLGIQAYSSGGGGKSLRSLFGLRQGDSVGYRGEDWGYGTAC